METPLNRGRPQTQPPPPQDPQLDQPCSPGRGTPRPREPTGTVALLHRRAATMSRNRPSSLAQLLRTGRPSGPPARTRVLRERGLRTVNVAYPSGAPSRGPRGGCGQDPGVQFLSGGTPRSGGERPACGEAGMRPGGYAYPARYRLHDVQSCDFAARAAYHTRRGDGQCQVAGYESRLDDLRTMRATATSGYSA